MISVTLEWIAAEPPSRIAERARLDLLAEERVGELRDACLTHGDGDATRMDWIPQADRPRSVTADFAIWPLGWREFELRFTPAKTGSVQLHLMGPWQQTNKETIKQEVLWDSLRADGAALINGSFEQVGAGSIPGWKNQGGIGEFGAIDKADAVSRANYYRAVRQQCEAANMGWAIWDWKAAFRYWDVSAQRPLPGMHEALFGK